MKTQGVCAQRQVGVFMIRIRVPGGKASPEQLERVADLARRYGGPSIHVTSRAGLELHHVRIGDVPAVRSGLAEVGLTTKGACGDTIRNVVACAHAGTFAGEVLPVAPFVRLLHERIVAISDATNLSRKMNVAIACSPLCDAHVATSDIGFVATPDPAGGTPTFAVWGAGGLGATPRLAIEMRRGVAQRDVAAAFDALVALGTTYADRSARAKAKIKLLVDAWGADRVREVFDDEFAAARASYAASAQSPVPLREIERTARSRETAARNGADVPAPALVQKQPGRYTIPALVPMGELSIEGARVLAAAASRFGDNVVHFTPEQNAELQDVRECDVAAAIAAIEDAGLRTAGRGGISDVLSCVGLDYCPLAVTHAMSMGEELSLAFAARRDEPRYADFRIHVSGCPHSCAKHQVADIGLAGATTERDGMRVEAYVLSLGGNARERRLGAVYPVKIARTDVRRVVAATLDTYEERALPGERFSATIARLGAEAFFAGIAEAPAASL